ncbi:MAG TPA: hypothetical protein VKX35_05065 [Fermentimonas sp.]|nr:hypothetical protein [Fermentimonas sp.]
MNLHKIAPNLYITDNPLFKNYRKEYIHELLKTVITNFATALNIEPFSGKPCYINYDEGTPKCISFYNQASIILISAKGDYLTNWVFEFSHEYCHHLIDGSMQPEIKGLIWFEETICQLSSLYNLKLIGDQWNQSSDINKLLNYNSFLKCFNGYLTNNQLLVDQINHPGWLSAWLPFLSEPKYYRDHYNALAVKMLPLFLENPNLWKIILHFGDSRKWNTLDDLFVHLTETVDFSYSYHLNKLSELLFN